MICPFFTYPGRNIHLDPPHFEKNAVCKLDIIGLLETIGKKYCSIKHTCFCVLSNKGTNVGKDPGKNINPSVCVRV